MGAPRKNPPPGAAETIQRLAAEGYSKVGLAMHFKISRDTFQRWIEEMPEIEESFEFGRETERQALHASIVASAKAGDKPNINAFFILKARHGYVEADHRSNAVNVDVKVSNVMVVPSLGSDDEWERKAAEQQSRLVIDAATPAPSLPSPTVAAQTPYYGPPRLEPQTAIDHPAFVSPVLPPAPSWNAAEWRAKA